MENLIKAQDYIFKAIAETEKQEEYLNKAIYYLKLELSWIKRINKRSKVLSALNMKGGKNELHR